MTPTQRNSLDDRPNQRWYLSGIAGIVTALVIVSGCVGEMAAPLAVEVCLTESSRTCVCTDGDLGVQSCEREQSWSACRCSCTPHEVIECPCAEGQGLRSCHYTGEFWEPCQCLTEEERVSRAAQEAEDDPRCSAGENWCEGVGCVSLANSATNCGACGLACDGCDRCFRGACTTVCCPDETNCGTDWNPSCSDLDSDSLNCGACGIECTALEVCVGGTCLPS